LIGSVEFLNFLRGADSAGSYGVKADELTLQERTYRATCRARSPAEFIAKIGVAAEEADESKGWLQLLVKASFATNEQAGALIQEADELTAIFVASRKTAERNQAIRKEARQRKKKTHR